MGSQSVNRERAAEYERLRAERVAWAREVDPEAMVEWESKSQGQREREFDAEVADKTEITGDMWGAFA